MIDTAVLEKFRNALGPKGIMTDPADIEPWVHDWRGRYHGAAALIVSPANTQEMAAAVRIAAEHDVPIVPQGGNTSMVGGATPPADGSAIILSTRRMNAIRSISPEDNLAICEAGVILSNLHEAAEQAGRRFPLSLGAKGSATIGGLISTNAGGTQVLRHGTMRSLVAGLEAVLPDGSIYSGLAPLKKDNRGYDLKQVLIGAEGTIGIVTAAALRLCPAIADRAVAWIGVESPRAALSILRLLEQRLGNIVEGFEVMADDGIGHVLSHIPGTRCPIETRTPWHALIEVDMDEARDPGASILLEQALGEAFGQGLLADATIAASDAQAEAFWRIRESISESERAQGPALQYDISVPVSSMPEFMIALARDAETAFTGTTASSFGHLGDGNFHFHVRMPGDYPTPAKWTAENSEVISRFVHDAVVAAGGSISAEHGIGQMKIAELARLASPAQLAGMRAIKHGFDPKGLFNPGKLVP